MPTDTPVPPFGATVDGVTALVPEARLLTSAPAIGQHGVTVDQVQAWVEELTGVVAMTLDHWQRLSDTPAGPETTSDREQLAEYARTIIHNGAASYLDAARYPERSSGYATVLWERYTSGLDRVAAWLTRRLAEQQPGDTPVEQSTSGGFTDYSFPAPLVGDRLRF